MIIRLGTTMSINTYSKTVNSVHTTRILNLKYVIIDFLTPNLMLKYTKKKGYKI